MFGNVGCEEGLYLSIEFSWMVYFVPFPILGV